MKKFLSCCLCVALIFTLLCPLAAAAAGPQEEPEPAEEVTEEGAPGEQGEDEQDVPALYYPAELYEIFDLPPLEEWGVDDIEWYMWMLSEAVYGYYLYYVLTPLPEVPLWAALDPSAESLEEFLEKFGIDMAEYIEYEQLWDDILNDYQLLWGYMHEDYTQRRDRQLEELGGTPGIVNVMYNGSFFEFADAVPEIKDGHTFVPARLFFETLGAEVSYDPQENSITAAFEDYSARLVIGYDKMDLTGAFDEPDLILGAAPYISGGGVSYIPARAVAEALGLDVYWDSYYETVVIIDTAGLIADIDKDFIILNNLLAMSIAAAGEREGVSKTDLSLSASVKMFDSLDGDKEAAMGADITVISDGKSFSVTAGLDLSALVDLIVSEYLNDPYYYYYYGLGQEDIQAMEALSESKAELIFNYDDDVLYISLPFLSSQIPELPEGAWIAIGGFSEIMSDPYMYYYFGIDRQTVDLLDSAGDGGLSVGALLYSSNSFYSSYNQIYLYGRLTSAVDDFRAIFGDDRIAVQEDGYALSVTSDDLIDQEEDEDEDEEDTYWGYSYYSYITTTFELDVAVKTDGEKIAAASGRYRIRESYYYGSTTQTTLEFDITSDSVSFSFELHEKNVSVIRIQVNLTTAEADAPIVSGPPAGATVVPIEDLIEDGYDYWYESVEPLSYSPGF